MKVIFQIRYNFLKTDIFSNALKKLRFFEMPVSVNVYGSNYDIVLLSKKDKNQSGEKI